MSLIDDTYFIREITIAQLGQFNGNLKFLNLMIEKYEPKFLDEALGYGFSSVMLANQSQPRFVSLISGEDYTHDGILRKWIGLANNTEKISPIANYVYWWCVKYNWEQQAGTGTVRPKNENSKVVAPEYSMIKAWDEMVDMIHQMRCFIHANISDYPEYKSKAVRCFTKVNHYGI